MDGRKLIMNGLSEITGLASEELEEVKNENMFEIGLMDSLSLIGLFAFLEDETGRKFDLTKYQAEDFSSISALIRIFPEL